MGRPKKEIKWAEVEKLCALQCTQEEIAWFCECSVETLERRSLELFEMSFSAYFKEKRGTGKIALRRKQWQLAVEKGNVTMLIWLGKQYLGQGEPKEDPVDPREADQEAYPAMTKDQAQVLLEKKLKEKAEEKKE